MDIPRLATERLVLRGFLASDWDAFANMNANPAVRRWLGGNLLSRDQAWTSMATLLGQWTLRGYGVFAVETDSQFAGRVGVLHPSDWPEPELAWALAESAWGHGFATEAARAVRTWAFANFGWERLVSYIASNNHRSRRVAEKLGAVCDGQVVLRGFALDIWVHPAPGQGVTT